MNYLFKNLSSGPNTRCLVFCFVLDAVDAVLLSAEVDAVAGVDKKYLSKPILHFKTNLRSALAKY